jgi:hypothetical protein
MSGVGSAQVGAIRVSDADRREALGAPSDPSPLRQSGAGSDEALAGADGMVHGEEVFVSQLHRRARLLDGAFQRTVLCTAGLRLIYTRFAPVSDLVYRMVRGAFPIQSVGSTGVYMRFEFATRSASFNPPPYTHTHVSLPFVPDVPPFTPDLAARTGGQILTDANLVYSVT